MAREFPQNEKDFLHLAGADIPLTLTPFQDMAKASNLSEKEALTLLKNLKEEKVIRRFGATLRHQKAGYGKNAMVAWRPSAEQDTDAIGEILAAYSEISHCYKRKIYDVWPYSIYTMIHGKEEGDCLETVARIQKETGMTDYVILRSIKELKKTSMVYF